MNRFVLALRLERAAVGRIGHPAMGITVVDVQNLCGHVASPGFAANVTARATRAAVRQRAPPQVFYKPIPRLDQAGQPLGVQPTMSHDVKAP